MVVIGSIRTSGSTPLPSSSSPLSGSSGSSRSRRRWRMAGIASRISCGYVTGLPGGRIAGHRVMRAPNEVRRHYVTTRALIIAELEDSEPPGRAGHHLTACASFVGCVEADPPAVEVATAGAASAAAASTARTPHTVMRDLMQFLRQVALAVALLRSSGVAAVAVAPLIASAS
jgi:hypothetical protein